MANSKGVKNTVSMPGYPPSGPPLGEGTQIATGPPPTGDTGTPGGGTDLPIGVGLMGPATQARANAGSTHDQPRHPAENTDQRGPSARLGSTHSQPHHPAETKKRR